jgi:hypothetical protein
VSKKGEFQLNNKIVFYQYTPILYVNNLILLPRYLVVFTDELATKMEELTFILHEVPKDSERSCNYKVKSKNLK